MKKVFNLSKEGKKKLISTIEGITGVPAKYLGVPSCAYQIGDFKVNRDCSVESDDPVLLEALMADLRAEGFFCEDSAELISISVPAEKVNVENLICLLAAKSELIKKALGVNDIGIRFDEERVWFPWFKSEAPAEMHAYANFVQAICRMSVEQKRITAKPREVENEKYAFRVFLLRLGFIGDEFKEDRKILLKNLEGSSAWKNEKVV